MGIWTWAMIAPVLPEIVNPVRLLAGTADDIDRMNHRHAALKTIVNPLHQS